MNIVKIIGLLISITLSYKQFKLVRTSLEKNLDVHCYNQDFSSIQQKYTQLCYQKDISYNLEMYIDNILYYVSLDFTTPYTWFKSPQCIQNNSNNCAIIHDKQKHKLQKQRHQSKTKLTFFNQQMIDNGQNSIVIYGSTNLVLGNVETIKNGELQVINSQNMKDLLKLFGISLFLISQTQTILLSNYNFIKASKLSYDINALSDGSLSLVNSHNSTLNNIFHQLLSKYDDDSKIISIYINAKAKKGVFAFGEISLKYTSKHKIQIKWIPLISTQAGYKFNTSSLLIWHNQDHSNLFSDQQSIQTYFSVSTSNIHLPSSMIQYIKHKFAQITKASCKFNQKQLLQCRWKTIQHKMEVLFLKFYFKINDNIIITIPITTLINLSDDLFMQFTIKSSESNFIILGEPFFEQYIVYLDLKNEGSLIGLATSYSHNPDFQAKMVIYILRILLFTFLGLIILYIFFAPLCKFYNKFKQALQKRKKKVKVDNNQSRYHSVPQQQILS